jgi:hypothetical protein
VSLYVGTVSYRSIAAISSPRSSMSRVQNSEGSTNISRPNTITAVGRVVSLSTPNEEVPDVGEDQFDLKIPMSNWAGASSNYGHPSRRPAKLSFTQDTRYQRSRAQSPHDLGPAMMTPPPTVRKAPRQPSRCVQDRHAAEYVGSSANTPVARRHNANPQTARGSQVRMKILFVRRPNGYAEDHTCFDNGIPPADDPVCDPEHYCHHDCGVPLPSVEQTHTRQDCAILRAKRRYQNKSRGLKYDEMETRLYRGAFLGL